MGDLRNHLEVRHIQFGITDRFHIDGAGLRGDGLPEGFRVAGVNELRRAAQLGQGVMKQRVGAPIKVVPRDNLVSNLRDGQQGKGDGRRTRGDGQRAGPAFDRGHPLLENVRGRIHQPRVDVAEFLQGEQIGGVFGALEHVGGGLINGHGPRAGGRIRDLAGMQRQRAEVLQ